MKEPVRQGITMSERSKWIATETVAQFAPLLCGGLSHDKERALLRLLEGPRFCGHPDLQVRADPVDVAGVAGLPVRANTGAARSGR